MIAGRGRAAARDSPHNTETAKICFSPSDSRCFGIARPVSSYRVIAKESGGDQHALDQGLLAEQVSKRLRDQLRQSIDLPLRRPPQIVLHGRLRANQQAS